MTAGAQSSSRRGTLGDYEILHPLKTGGMGEVLLARKRGTAGFEKLLALKTIRGEFRDSDHLQKMFVDEARLLSRLNHPQIAQVYDFGEQEGVFYLAMEYVPGIRFRDLIRRRPPAVISVRAMAEVLRGLHAAHELTDLAGESLGVVHRDVTPENLILTYDGRVKILDFGIALVRGRQAPVTEFGSVKGKPPYLAPEQLKNEAVDRRTDVFSAALVLHELLTGNAVFVGDSVYAVARAIDLQDIPPPSAKAGPLPSGLDEVVLHGLAKSADERWASAKAFSEALETVARKAGGPSLAEFAATELASERDEHRRHLRDVLEQAEQGRTPRPGNYRATGVVTAQAAIPGHDPQSLVKKLTHQRPAIRLGDGATPRRLAPVDDRVTQPRPAETPGRPEPTDHRVTEPRQAQTAEVADTEPAEADTAGTEPTTFTTAERNAIGASRKRKRFAVAVVLLVLAGAAGLGAGLLGKNKGEQAAATPSSPDAGALATHDAGTAVAEVPPDAATVARSAATDASAPATRPAVRVARHPDHRPRRKPKPSPKKPTPTPTAPTPTPPPSGGDPPSTTTPLKPAPTGFGKLTIGATPHAKVRINGRLVGETPIVGRRFPAGQHVIEWLYPDTKKLRHRRVVELAAGAHERVIIE